MNTPFSRRRFLRRNLTAVLGAAVVPELMPASALGLGPTPPPSNRIQVACIGVGPQGRGVMGNFLGQPDARVRVVCDLNASHLALARDQVNLQYKDGACETSDRFEEVLARRDIDAVLIATPDHWHVPVALAAARAGKDMYLEKPMGLSVEDDQALRKAVHQHKRIFQFGTQQRSGRQFRQACELVRNGRLGTLQEIHVWCSASRPGGSTKPVPPPAGLDYRRWLGPAPTTPHTEDKCVDGAAADHWKTWWFNYDYALGFIAGWGVHPLDIAYWGYPKMLEGIVEVEGQALIPSTGACNTPVSWDVNFTFATGVRMKYRGTRNGTDASRMNDLGEWERKYGRISDHGTAFVGQDGWVLVDRGGIHTSPEKLIEEPLGANAIHLVESSNHAGNFLQSVRTRKPAICHIDDAVQADVLCHLSDISTRLDRRLRWDPKKESFLADAEANRRLLRR